MDGMRNRMQLTDRPRAVTYYMGWMDGMLDR
jgi:hypothetical protein